MIQRGDPPIALQTPLQLLDPAAGEGAYTEHLPDGMGQAPALTLVDRYG